MEKTRIPAAIAVALLVLSMASCKDPFRETEGRPAIPIPDRYEDEVPLVSDVLVIEDLPANSFSPIITQYVDTSSVPRTPALGTRVTLVVDGAVAAPGGIYQALSTAEIPRIQFVRYWRRIGNVETYAGGSTTEISRTITQGSSTTNTQKFEESLSIEAESEAGGIFASASVKASVSFTATQEFTSTVTAETSDTWTFSVSPRSGTNMTYTVWQLVEEFRFVDADGELYDTPKYDFDPASLQFVYPTDEVAPVSAYYE